MEFLKSLEKKINKKYLLLIVIALISYFGRTIGGVTQKFLVSVFVDTLIFPVLVYALYDDFAALKSSKKPPKLKKEVKIGIIIAIYFTIFNSMVFMKYMDLPNAIKKEYKIVEGLVTNQVIKGGMNSKQYFEVEGQIYYAPANAFEPLEKGSMYKISMLEKSKYIVAIEKIED